MVIILFCRCREQLQMSTARQRYGSQSCNRSFYIDNKTFVIKTSQVVIVCLACCLLKCPQERAKDQGKFIFIKRLWLMFISIISSFLSLNSLMIFINSSNKLQPSLIKKNVFPQKQMQHVAECCMILLKLDKEHIVNCLTWVKTS